MLKTAHCWKAVIWLKNFCCKYNTPILVKQIFMFFVWVGFAIGASKVKHFETYGCDLLSMK